MGRSQRIPCAMVKEATPLNESLLYEDTAHRVGYFGIISISRTFRQVITKAFIGPSVMGALLFSFQEPLEAVLCDIIAKFHRYDHAFILFVRLKIKGLIKTL